MRRGGGILPLTAAPSVIAAFLTDQAEPALLTLSRRVASRTPPRFGLSRPAGDIENHARPARRHLADRQARPESARPAEWIAAMLEGIPNTLCGTRDRALLTRGLAGAFAGPNSLGSPSQI